MTQRGNDMVIATDIHRTYRSGEMVVHALRGVDLTVARGSVTAVLGKPASGKTSLLNCLGSLDRPDRGTIDLFGTELTRLSDEAAARWRRQHLGYLDQTNGLLPWLTARQNVEVPLQTTGAGRLDRRRRASDALERVGLLDWATHLPDELSGGQRRRVAVARAIANEPRLLLVDEPTAALDEATGSAILKLLRRIAKSGTTIVIATHDGRIRHVADHVVELSDGVANPMT